MTTMPSVLDAICRQTRARLQACPPDMASVEARLQSAPPPRDAYAALSAQGTRIIAEFKRSSPSEGPLGAPSSPAETGRLYTDAGAAAISVLTEPERFGGSFADLDAMAGSVPVPVLCKDFMVDPRQFVMARAHGASMALLIVAALSDRELRDYREHAEALGLACLVETHDREEVDRAVASGARIIGVNSRNLHTLSIDLAVAESLREAIPSGAIAVAESGIQRPEDIARLKRAGYSAFLIGSSLMRSPLPGALLRSLIAAGGPTPDMAS